MRSSSGLHSVDRLFPILVRDRRAVSFHSYGAIRRPQIERQVCDEAIPLGVRGGLRLDGSFSGSGASSSQGRPVLFGGRHRGRGSPALCTGCSCAVWQVSTGDWSVTGNWNGGIPVVGDGAAVIDNGGTASVTQPGEGCRSLLIGQSNLGAVQMTGGGLSVGYEYIGNASRTGNFTQSGGNHETGVLGNGIEGGDLVLGAAAGSTGNYVLTGSGQAPAIQTDVRLAVPARETSRSPAASTPSAARPCIITSMSASIMVPAVATS